MGQHVDAVKAYREALRLDPGYEAARLGLGEAEAALRRTHQ